MKLNIKSIIVILIFLCLTKLNNNEVVLAQNLLGDVFYLNQYNRLEGAIDNKYKINMILYYDNDEELVGNYFYTRYQGKIKLVGKVTKDKILKLVELDEEGNEVATFVGEIVNREFVGRWIRLIKPKVYNFNLNIGGSFWGTREKIYAAFTSKTNEEVEDF
ncbi:hypothetical protein [Halonatronum saccharophilum]|uniref:hypothetical protein n=1 Tax=Halonatronum saccharophilum TaxID=150060 RepID=UPI000484A578|nr:hypothetical protein [Halonatronum saccharophilum]